MEIIFYIFLVIAGKLIAKEGRASVINSMFENMSDYAEKIMSADFTVMKIAEAMIPVGICLTVLYWGINLMKTINFKDFSIEIIYKSLIRLVIGCIIVSNITALTSGFVSFSTQLREDMDTIFEDDVFNFDGLEHFLEENDIEQNLENRQEYLEDSTGNIEEGIEDGDLSDIEDKLSDKGMIRAIFAMVEFLIYMLLIQALRIVLAFLGFTRAIDLARKVVTSPLLVANIYGTGAANEGFREIREIFAVCMREPIMYLIAIIGTYAMGAQSNFLAGFMILIATISLLFKTKSISEQLFV